MPLVTALRSALTEHDRVTESERRSVLSMDLVLLARAVLLEILRVSLQSVYLHDESLLHLIAHDNTLPFWGLARVLGCIRCLHNAYIKGILC